jgi:succinyl-CoA synthetase alpha subunit
LSVAGLGQSTCIGLGGDPVVGLNFVEVLKMFESDKDTRAVALVCEIGGNLEELAAEYISQSGYSKPVVAFVAGRVAPAEKKMGHAGAIIMGKSGTVQGKTQAFQAAGVGVATRPSDIARMLTTLLEGKNISVSGQSET